MLRTLAETVWAHESLDGDPRFAVMVELQPDLLYAALRAHFNPVPVRKMHVRNIHRVELHDSLFGFMPVEACAGIEELVLEGVSIAVVPALLGLVPCLVCVAWNFAVLGSAIFTKTVRERRRRVPLFR